jgi:MYXO-CTERM domain-containing protein
LNQRLPFRLLLAVALVLSVSALGRDLPDFNIRANARPALRNPSKVVPGVPGQIASRDERTGSPTFIWANPSHTSAAVSAALASRAPAEAVARAHLADYAAHFGLDAAALKALEVRQVHDTGTGAIVVRLAPRVGNLEIFDESIAVVMDRYRQPIAISGTIRGSLPGEADALLAGFKMQPEQVVGAAYKDLVGVDGFRLRSTGQFKGDYQYFELAGSGAPERLVTPARAKPVAFRNGKRLEAAYYLELDTVDTAGNSHGYGYVVSARTGQVFVRSSLVASDFSYRVWADSSGQFRPFDGPYGTAVTPSASGTLNGTPLPAFVAPNLVTLDHGPISTGDPWLPAGATETSGNNVDAYSNTVPPDGFTGTNPDGGVPDLRADVTSPGVFDRTYDVTKGPVSSVDQQKASITQLFFINNWLHDWYYDVGFDEASGNAQQDNLGRASADSAGDPIHAQTQDFSGVDNANMFTPADGASPRMRMYVFDTVNDNKLTINTPAGIAGGYRVGVADFGPQLFNLTADLVLVNDSGVTTGCNPITTAVTGKIAIIDRGTCGFAVKALNAQNAGAVGVIIANNAAGIINMTGGNASNTIPVMSVSLADGTTIKGGFASGTVNGTMSRRAPFLDGALDQEVVAHEWGHYISNRLVGGGAGINAPVSRGMGEGWADFHAMLLIVRPEDASVASNATWNGTYAIGVYATSGLTLTQDAIYFGIRRYPYSTDMNKNPLTFKHITTGVPLPAGPPVNFTGDNAEVHNTGEVWAQMLWECYAALLNHHTFQDAQHLMQGYLVAAYKVTPPDPTFVEARDALLAVVGANDADDYQLVGQAFAKRGLGTGAVAPDRNDTTNGQPPHPALVESFVWAPDIYVQGLFVDDSIVSCDSDGVIDRGETGLVSLVLQNGGATALSQGTVTVATGTPGVSFADGGVFSVGTIAAGESATVRMPVKVALIADAGPTAVDFSLSVTDPEVDAGVAATRVLSGTASFRIDTDDIPNGTATDDVEGTATAWTTRSGPAGSSDPWVRFEFSPTDHAWFAIDPNRRSDESLISPSLQVGTAPLVITFQAAWDEEFDSGGDYDGVVLEVSEDDGATWKDVKTVGGTLNPDYNVTLLDEGVAPPGFTNPLQGRRAWGRANPASVTAGGLAFDTVTANLGTTFASKTIRIRFRSGSDLGGAFTGFILDDISFTGITNTPFVKLVADRLKCVPTANAGAPITVNERAAGMLGGSVTQTPGTTPPKLLWAQTSGPAIALSDPTVAQPTFVAPDVPADTTANFTLTATGIQGTSTSTTTVTIKDVNRPPIAKITGPTEVAANGTITLSGSTSTDPDNDPLTYAWTQTSGPQVTLNGANTDTMSFTAPDSSGNIGIQLTVTDSKGASATATTTIAINKKSGCSSSGGSPAPLLALLALGLLARVRRRTA